MLFCLQLLTHKWCRRQIRAVHASIHLADSHHAHENKYSKVYSERRVCRPPQVFVSPCSTYVHLWCQFVTSQPALVLLAHILFPKIAGSRRPSSTSWVLSFIVSRSPEKIKRTNNTRSSSKCPSPCPSATSLPTPPANLSPSPPCASAGIFLCRRACINERRVPRPNIHNHSLQCLRKHVLKYQYIVWYS